MTTRQKGNLAVIILVGVGMPAYYKIKYTLLGQIGWHDVFHWTIFIDIAFATSLAVVVLFAHDVVVQRLRAGFDRRSSHLKRFLIQLLVTGLTSIGAVYMFTKFFFTFLYPSAIPSDFLFDMILMGVFLPLLVAGVDEGLYFYGEWERAALKRELLEKENIQARYRILQSQLNPHFLFNCLNTLTELIEESRELAGNFARRLSGVYRFVLESQDNDLVELGDELRLLDSYLFLVDTRFGDTVRVTTEISEDARSYSIVPLTLQMLLENALKHNVASEEHPLDIRIEITAGPSLLFHNNIQRKSPSRSTQLGLKNINDRYRFVAGEGLDIQETPTRFSVKLPLLQLASA